MLYVTHDLATARHFAEDIMVMYRGTVVERGPSDEVILEPAHPYTKMLGTAAPDPGADRAVLAEARRARIEARGARAAERREHTAPGACVFVARCPHARDLCAEAPPAVDVAEGHTARCWMLTKDYPRGG
jgi:peptide/nickel transport system ATP-binding protein